jgi:DNA polymerase V
MGHGGKRKGAGRPKGKGPYGESTKPIRVPLSLLKSTQLYLQHQGYHIPLYRSKVPAGLPAPADEALEKNLDLNQYLIKHPKHTFCVRASGHSMIDAGIYENDLLIVDRSLEAKNGKIVIAAIDGQLTVKRLKKEKNGKLFLLPENKKYKPIEVKEGSEIYIWGVVISVIHSL